MPRLVYDIETDGLLHEMTKVHCIVTQDLDTGVVKAYYEAPLDVPELPPAGTIADGIAALNAAERIGHNIVCFDERALEPFGLVRSFSVLDTMVTARVLWPDEHLKALDYAVGATKKRFELPENLFGRQSLKAWGFRLHVHKDDFGPEHEGEDKWAKLTPAMLRYCAQDVRVTCELARMLQKHIDAGAVKPRALKLENEFAYYIALQSEAGFPFDSGAAMHLSHRLLARKAEIHDELVKTVPPFVDKYITPKKRIEKTRTTMFNPSSRPHVIRHLKERLGWKPKIFTDGGKRPKLDSDVLDNLDLPGSQLFKEYFKLEKILGMVSEGKSAWTKLVGPDGRIHGYVNHNGAVTGRCTHSKPNVTQVPKIKGGKDKKPLLGYAGGFGVECRALFKPRDGWVLVGGDASGLELRMLAHYMAEYDGGEYASIVCHGDVHQRNTDALGSKYTREDGKRFIYAFLYGAGNAKLAKVLHCTVKEAKATRKRFLQNLPALAKTISMTKKAASSRKKLRLPDGRLLHVRSEYASLNTRLQGTGAIVMKLACVMMHRLLNEKGYKHGQDYAQVHQAHDELQVEARPEIAEEVGKAIVEGIRIAGEKLGIRCPLTGDYKVGRCWAETH